MTTTKIRGYEQILDNTVKVAQLSIDDDLAFGSHKITGLADGVNPQDAVTKAQLDAFSGGSVAWVDITGKPSSYPPGMHFHGDVYYNKDEVASLHDAIVWQIQSHTHDEINNDLQINGKLTAGYVGHSSNSQYDVSLFGNGSIAQSGAYFSKLRIFGGSSQSRSIDIYQQVSEYAHIGSSLWTANKLYIDTSFSDMRIGHGLAVGSHGVTPPTDGLYVDGVARIGSNSDTTARINVGTTNTDAVHVDFPTGYWGFRMYRGGTVIGDWYKNTNTRWVFNSPAAASTLGGYEFHGGSIFNNDGAHVTKVDGYVGVTLTLGDGQNAIPTNAFVMTPIPYAFTVISYSFIADVAITGQVLMQYYSSGWNTFLTLNPSGSGTLSGNLGGNFWPGLYWRFIATNPGGAKGLSINLYVKKY